MTSGKDTITTESANPASEGLDQMSATEIVRLMNDQDGAVVAAVAGEVEAIGRAVAATAERLRGGGRLFYLGAGTSGRLGVLDASECPPTFSTDPELVQGFIAGGDTALRHSVEGAEDDREAGAEELRQRSLTAADVVVGIAASGGTPYVLGALEFAQEVGSLTVAITCNADAPIAARAKHPLVVVVGPEVLAGSTRLKAGTATKMVLNMLSTGVMVLLGKTYGNLMVDLQASNIKLEARALRLLCRLTDLAEPEARQLLADCDGELKTAILASRSSLPIETARTRLSEAGGRLRTALTNP